MKTWLKIKNYVIYSIIATLLLLTGLYVYAEKTAVKYPDYSTYSSKQMGLKALYLLAEATGYDVYRYEGTARFIPDGVFLIIVRPELNRFSDNLERKYLKEWIERGNTMIFINDNSKQDIYGISEFTGISPNVLNSDKYSTVYGVKKGKIAYFENSDNYTNLGLKKVNPGIAFIKLLDASGIKGVYFNEYYHGFGKEGVSLWNLFGQAGTLITIQFFGGLFILLFYKWRRFGKPVTVFDIEKRKENENLYALSNIYIKSNANSIVFENYFKDFKKQLSKYLGFNIEPDNDELIRTAASNKFLNGMDIKSILDECRKYSHCGKMDKKRLIYLVKKMEEIRKGII